MLRTLRWVNNISWLNISFLPISTLLFHHRKKKKKSFEFMNFFSSCKSLLSRLWRISKRYKKCFYMRKFMAFNSWRALTCERQSQEKEEKFDYIINIIISQYRVKFTRRRVKYVRIIAYKVEKITVIARLLVELWLNSV